jgi:hypothetical protein
VGGRGIELELPVVDTLKGHSLNKAVARRVVLRLCSLCRWGEEKLRLPVEMQRDLSCWATQIACQNLSLFTSASNDSLPHGPCGLKSQKSLAYDFSNLKVVQSESSPTFRLFTNSFSFLSSLSSEGYMLYF